MFEKLEGVVTESYNKLDSEAGITDNMKPLLGFTSQMSFMFTALTNAKSNASYLQIQVNSLESNLENVTTLIEISINASCAPDPECIDMVARVNNVSIAVNYSSISGAFDPLIGELSAAINVDLHEKLEAGYSEFNDIIGEVNSSVIDEINDARQKADDVAQTISNELDNIQDEMDSIGFNGTVQDLQDVSDDIKEPADYTRYGMTGIAILLLLIVLFSYLGLLFGCFCPQAKPGDGKYCCTRKVGATCLLAGVGFTFIFFWILMILLIALMLSGGLLHTELCRHLVDLDQSPVMSIIDQLMNDTLYDETGFYINISDIYSNCRDNEAFYTALNVEETFNFDLDTMLDTSTIETAIENIRNQNITIDPISILTPEAEILLTSLADQVDSTKVEVEDAIAELRKEVTSEDLGQLADDLEDFNQGQNIPYFDLLIVKLRGLNNVTDDIDDQKQITLDELTEVNKILSTNLTAITIGLGNGNATVNDDGEDIIESVIDNTTYSVERLINDAVSIINESVRYDIGQCVPVYNAYSIMVDSGCVELLYPVNGYWFALGWSLFFLIVGVIMSFKLATMYRKTYRPKNAVYPDIRHDK